MFCWIFCDFVDYLSQIMWRKYGDKAFHQQKCPQISLRAFSQTTVKTLRT